MLVNLLGIFFSIKVLLAAVKWSQKIFITFLPVLFIFTHGPTKQELLTKPIYEQLYHNFSGTIRQDSRLILGRIIPLKASYFKNLNEEDIIMLPKPEDALIQLNSTTNDGIERISNSVPQIQKQIKTMGRSFWNLFTQENNKKISKLN